MNAPESTPSPVHLKAVSAAGQPEPTPALQQLYRGFERELLVPLWTEIGGLMPETFRPGPDPESGPQPPKASREPTEVVERESLGEKIARTFEKGRNLLVELVGEVETQKIIDSMPNDAALDVRVNIGFKTTKRKPHRIAMTELEKGLRNIADGEIIARGKHGEARGDDARLSMDMGVKRLSESSGLLDPADAFEKMQEVHRRFVFDGKLGS